MLNNSRLGTGNPWLNLELLKEDMEYDGNADFNNFDVENDERTNKNNNTINLAAKDIFPALHLGKESLASLVRAIFSSSQDTPDKILDGFFCEMLGWNNNSDSCISSSLVPIYSALGAPHTLSVINTDLKTSRKNINLVPFPVTVHMVRDNGSSQLELDTRHCAISDRLTTSLKSSRRFSLRSVMGIRALAFIQQYQHHQAIQLQVECSLPDLQFTFNPISQPNILASRLSEHLAGLRAAPETTHSESLHFGYLCYTRSRKVATVLESNPNLQSVTTEGVWVRLEDDADLVVGNDADRSLLTHPLCWGACARFICSEHVNRRPGRPFLLLVFNPSRGTMRSFEVQVNNDPAANTPLAITHVSHSMNMSYQYEGAFIFIYLFYLYICVIF